MELGTSFTQLIRLIHIFANSDSEVSVNKIAVDQSLPFVLRYNKIATINCECRSDHTLSHMHMHKS